MGIYEYLLVSWVFFRNFLKILELNFGLFLINYDELLVKLQSIIDKNTVNHKKYYVIYDKIR